MFATAEFDPETYGVAAISIIENYVAGHDEIGPGEAKAWAEEQHDLGRRGEFFFACIQFCFTATRPA